jgi:hypothetical protein
VAGDSEEHLYQGVTELLGKMWRQVIDVSAVSPVFPVSDAFQAAVTDVIRRSSVFIGILGGDGSPTPEQADGVVIEAGRRPIEIEYAVATTLGVPKLLYVRESLLDSDSWLTRFFRDVSKEHFFRGFTYDDELLKWLPDDLVLLTPQQDEATGPVASPAENANASPGATSTKQPRFLEETLRAFAVAEALRLLLDQIVIRRSILLFGLLEPPTGLAGLFLNSLGISREAVLELLGRKLSRGSKRAIDLTGLVDTAEKIVKFINLVLAQAPFSDSLRIALSAAESVAAEQNVDLHPDHLFIALMRSTEEGPGWIGWMLGSEKAEWIRRTLSDWSADTPFTEDSLRDKAIAAGLYSPASASSDAASKDDLLNFKQSASAMVNIVLKQDTVPPLVVGVYGPWGSGKSTYLELVKMGLLAEYDKIRKASDGSMAINLLVVEYDAWAYSDAPKLWAGLITKIAKKLDDDLGWSGRIKYLFKSHRARLVGGVLLGLIPLVLAVPAVLLGLLKPLSAGLASAAAGPLISVVSAWLNQRQAVYGNVRALASKFDSAPASGVINSIQDEFRDALESWIKQKTGADAADATTSTTTTSRSSYSSMSLTAVRSRGSSTYWRRSSSREGNLHCVYGCGHACRL